jgi:phosphoserine phosphatase RsbU/P
VTRESWKEKLISLDLLSKGYVVHSRVGENVVRGVAMGFAAFALSLLLTFIAGKITHTWYSRLDDSAIEGFGTFATWLYVLGFGLSANAYKLAIIILFTVSWLRRRVSSALPLVGLGALVLALTSRGDLSPLWLGMLIQLIAGAVSVWAFYRYDALASFLALFSFSVLQGVGGLLVTGNATYVQSGLIILAGLVLVLGGGLASQMRKKEITEFDDIMPAFAKHITERQHLQQELEIARSVQMSFLPKSNPKMAELDIASRCDPALEVGGDYYDFIDLREKRLGVVVGDVSGKGTQAAFFMTLTKGFVHALAEVSNSPSKVLTQVNKLFYENVDRGVFISMVYGVFDTQRHLLTLARAGHNPVIMRKTLEKEVQVVNPMGLALGLDPGATFAKSIQEVTIPFQSGDLFVFYTDGFPEAMNKTLEEFGEERLCHTVEKYSHGTAAQIMDGVFAEMRQFVGKAKQHDDMTIVVVKVV